MESEHVFVEPLIVMVGENSSAVPSYVLQRELQENTTLAPIGSTPLLVVPPRPGETTKSLEEIPRS